MLEDVLVLLWRFLNHEDDDVSTEISDFASAYLNTVFYFFQRFL